MEQIHNKKKRMPTILNEQQASLWISPNLTEQQIMQLAFTQIKDDLLEAHTIKKDFRTADNPMESYLYIDLPDLD
jgi:hypothetical protein